MMQDPIGDKSTLLNTLRQRQNGRHFADNIFKCIFLNENFWIPIKISLKFVPKGQINKIPALVQIMVWRRPGNKPLSEPMVVSLPTHICVIRPQWVKVMAWCPQTTNHYLNQSWPNSIIHHPVGWALTCKPTKHTLENRYGFWPQTGCVAVPGCEAAFLVARQRFPYRSRFNFSVKNMENMLPCNAICDIMHIDFSKKIYCGANDASIGF